MRGAGYELAVFNYSLDFDLVEENFGSYVCDMCTRIVRRIKRHEMEIKTDIILLLLRICSQKQVPEQVSGNKPECSDRKKNRRKVEVKQ